MKITRTAAAALAAVLLALGVATPAAATIATTPPTTHVIGACAPGRDNYFVDGCVPVGYRPYYRVEVTRCDGHTPSREFRVLALGDARRQYRRSVHYAQTHRGVTARVVLGLVSDDSTLYTDGIGTPAVAMPC